MTWEDIHGNEPSFLYGWNQKIIESGLHLKWSTQIKEIHDLWVENLPKIKLKLAEEQISPNQKIVSNPDNTFEIVDRTQERSDNIANLERKVLRGESVIKLCIEEERIRVLLESKGRLFKIPDQYKRKGERLDVSSYPLYEMPTSWVLERNPVGTTYYGDSDSGSDANSGLTTGLAWASLAQFTTTTIRSAGDIYILRNNTTANYGTSILDFDETGTINDPIIIERDYDNAFGDDVAVTPTGTFVEGDTAVVCSADVSAQVSVGDWIYANGDAPREFAYQVESLSTTVSTNDTINLYLPYLGDQEGSGVSITNIGTAPFFGSTTDTSPRMRVYSVYYWRIWGLEIRTNSNNPALDFQNMSDFRSYDMVFECGTTSSGEFVSTSAECSELYFEKFRAENFRFGFTIGDDPASGNVKNGIIDGNNKSGSYGVFLDGTCDVLFEQVTFRNNAFADVGLNAETTGYEFLNCSFESATETYAFGQIERFMFNQDYDRTVDKTAVLYGGTSVTLMPVIWESDTTTVRAGGNDVSIKVTPTDNVGEWKILRLPIEHDTSTKTYTIYVKTDATANWTANPTADELEVGFEYWCNATTKVRKLKKSTDTANFTGSTAWQGLSVSVTPAIAGQGFLTLKYRKPKEASVSNEFFIDPRPEPT